MLLFCLFLYIGVIDINISIVVLYKTLKTAFTVLFSLRCIILLNVKATTN